MNARKYAWILTLGICALCVGVASITAHPQQNASPEAAPPPETPGIDPQKKFHEDIVRDTMAYPLHSHPGIARPDTNIDRRRVPNLEWFSLA